ncbi:MAG: Mov34/MPN/PAD-1 family protein [Solibacillus sp.]
MRFEFGNCKLEIKQRVMDEFNNYVQTGRRRNESGGILIGRYIQDSQNAVIDVCTTPQPEDLQKRFFFQRNKKYHQKILNQIWNKSSSTQNYLGEWHTHPEIKPTPSSHDLREWKKLLNKQNDDIKYIFFIIVGIEEIGVWKGCTTCEKIVEMKGQ